MRAAWVLLASVLVLGHPLALAAAYGLCLSLGATTVVGTNVMRIAPVPFLAIAGAIGWLRWLWFRHRSRDATPTGRLRAFALANLPATPGLGLAALLLSPLEGNAVGFFLLPAWLLLTVIIAPLVWVLSRRLGAGPT
jgi:hypothetical protein